MWKCCVVRSCFTIAESMHGFVRYECMDSFRYECMGSFRINFAKIRNQQMLENQISVKNLD